MSLEYCTVTHSLRSTVPHAPAGITGRARFTPIMPPGDAWTVETAEGTVTVPAVPAVGVVENGELGPLEVFAGGDDSNPSIAMWRVEYFTLAAGKTTVELAPMLFKAIPGGSVDLAEIYPVSGSSPAGIVRGPQGDKGEKGDDGISPVLTGGTATTLPAGAAPTVGITGTKENPVLNIGVPLPARSSRDLIYTGTGTPLLSDFPDAKPGDYIVRKSDGQEWRVDP